MKNLFNSSTNESRNDKSRRRKIVDWITSIILGSSLAYGLFVFIIQSFPLRVFLQLGLLLLLCAILSVTVFYVSKYFGKPIWSHISKFNRISILFFSVILGIVFTFRFPVYPISNPLLNPAGISILNSPNPSLSIWIDNILGVVSSILSWGFLVYILCLLLGSKNKIKNWQFFLVMLVFLLYIVIGLFAYDDYGISVDEPAERTTSLVNLKYLAQRFYPAYLKYHLQGLDNLETFRNKHYGVAFQLPLAFFEEINGLTGDTIWLFRHFMTFLFFFLGIVAFWALAEEIFDDWKIALLGTIFFILTPRIFANGFYNIKDAVFLSAFTISMYFGIRYYKEPSTLRALLFGIVCAYATNIRIIAVYLLGIVIALVFIRQLLKGKIGGKKFWFNLMILIITYLFILILLFPASWENPIKFLFETVNEFANYQGWDGRIMYMGDYIRGQEPPWHYLPVWMLITVPGLYLILFIIGIIVTCQNVLTKQKPKLFWEENVIQVFLVLLFFIPPVSAIVFKSTLYNGWRHFYFVYTPLLLLALFGLKAIFRKISEVRHPNISRILNACFVGIIALNQIYLVSWMIVSHPFQNVYFNNNIVKLFGGKEAFERDYGRLSIRQGLEYILAHDDCEIIYYLYVPEVRKNSLILPNDGEKRFQYTAEITDETDYVIYPYREITEYPWDEYYSITVDDLTILSIYKLK